MSLPVLTHSGARRWVTLRNTGARRRAQPSMLFRTLNLDPDDLPTVLGQRRVGTNMPDRTVMTWNIQNLFPVGHADRLGRSRSMASYWKR